MNKEHIYPLIFIVLVLLKLTHVINWSWWIVCSPLLFAVAIICWGVINLGLWYKLEGK